jgi:serine/threonine protein kinase/ATP/maltotriose-dependent transcriptional regulator MalT
MIGLTVSHYRIVKELGHGAMGVVYLAEDLNFNRLVAIKTLNALNGWDNHHQKRRFQREAEAASTLKHRHIATIYEFGKTPEGDPFIVMEFVDGDDLADLMRKETLTIPRSLQIIKEVAEALEEAHQHGIIHRDIKPSNIAINRAGQVRVLDFGLAKQIEIESTTPVDPDRLTLLNTQTREGTIVGTPLYLSPEQALGVEVDPRSDLFSLGAVLYECISGHSPFSGNNPIEICAKVVRDDPLPPSQFNKDVTAELDRIALKALAKKAEERYQTARELITDLDLAGEELHSSSTQTVRRLKTPSTEMGHSNIFETLSDILKQPRLSVGYVVVGSILAVAVAFGVWFLTRPKSHQPTPEAQRWYEIGTNYLREGAYFKAIKPLQEAVNADDRFALAHARSAEAWTELDYTERAQMELLRVDGLVPDRSVLARVELLYLEGIRNTITRDFAAAINSYTEIAKAKNDGQSYLDLARAYERNDEIEKAIENVVTATTRDPQYAPAFLRRGILYGRKEDLPKATAAFDKAGSLFETLGDFEGSAEVLFQRGALFARIGKMAEAQTQLEKALDIARTSNNEYQQIKTMLQLSIVLQTRGQTGPAQQMASEAVQLAQRLGLENLATQGLIDLGDTYLVRREYASAETTLKQALDFAQRNKGRRNEARALLVLAKLYVQQEINTDVALSNLEQALQYFQQGGYNKEVSLAILLRGRARLLKGDYDGALQDFKQQTEFATQTNNQSQLASTHLLIGNLLESLERYPEALISFQKSFDIYQQLDVPITMGYLIVYQAEVHWHLGHLSDAKTTLARLPSIASRLDNNYQQVLQARSAVVESQLALSESNFPAAKLAAERAIKLSGKSINHTGVEAKVQLGSIQVRSGAKAEGLHTSREALDEAKQLKDEYLVSLAMLAYAEALLENNNPGDAREIALEAQKRFEQGKQVDSEWQAWLIAAQASQKLKDDSNLGEEVTEASSTLTALEEKWGKNEFALYLNRPDVAGKRKLLDDLARHSESH